MMNGAYGWLAGRALRLLYEDRQLHANLIGTYVQLSEKLVQLPRLAVAQSIMPSTFGLAESWGLSVPPGWLIRATWQSGPRFPIRTIRSVNRSFFTIRASD